MLGIEHDCKAGLMDTYFQSCQAQGDSGGSQSSNVDGCYLLPSFVLELGEKYNGFQHEHTTAL